LDLTGDVSPIYVVDGTVTGSFDINPDDVQDVTVLKGANATTLFGDIAKGGAIVINTKKAIAGRTSIEVNQGVTFDKVNILPNIKINMPVVQPPTLQGLHGSRACLTNGNHWMVNIIRNIRMTQAGVPGW
jgi:hypothetical protein